MDRGRIWRHFDFWLLGAVALLIIFGVAMIRSTTLTSLDTGIQALPVKQIQYTLLGVIILFIVSTIDYRLWGTTADTIYVVLIVLLLIVEILGVTSFGANRWIIVAGISLQPSEVGKFLITLTLGNYLATHPDEVNRWPFIFRTLLHIGVPVVLIFMQPDLSTAVMYGVVWFTLMWAGGLSWKYLAIMGGVAAILIPIGFIMTLAVEQFNYMPQRLITFILPDKDSEAYKEAAYNIEQALISIGSGGWFGQGYSQGSQVQLRFLKVRHTDFIFSAVAHEFGFVGAAFLILLIVFVVYRIFRAGRLARDAYGSYICYGVGIIIFYQSFFNIAMNMNILPVSGIPLPFVSYGGSALWTFLFGIGLVESVILRHKKIEF